MQMVNAKKESKLKTVKKLVWWVVATVVAVPITKWVESQFNFSFFSPAISGLWNWMNLSVSLPLWALVAVTVWALLMVGVVVWVIVDANAKLQAADTELNAANAKLSELNSIQAKLNSTQAELDAHKAELKTAHAEIAGLKEPEVPPLTPEQDKVISAIAAYDNADRECRTKDLPSVTELTLLQVEGASDVLAKRKLIQFSYATSGKYVTLTSEGRAYVLRPDFLPPLLPFMPVFPPAIFGRI
jgi:hypothetical protein